MLTKQCTQVHEIQLQHIPSSHKKTIYFDGKQIHTTDSYARDWNFSLALTKEIPLNVIIDMSTKPGVVKYDLMFDSVPFRRLGQVEGAAAAPSSSPRPSARLPTWQAPAASAAARAPGAPAGEMIATRAPAPAPAPVMDLLSFDDAPAAAAPQQPAASIFDPLASLASVGGVTDDLLSLNFGPKSVESYSATAVGNADALARAQWLQISVWHCTGRRR
jgi:hypothetical protein